MTRTRTVLDSKAIRRLASLARDLADTGAIMRVHLDDDLTLTFPIGFLEVFPPRQKGEAMADILWVTTFPEDQHNAHLIQAKSWAEAIDDGRHPLSRQLRITGTDGIVSTIMQEMAPEHLDELNAWQIHLNEDPSARERLTHFALTAVGNYKSDTPYGDGATVPHPEDK